MLVVDLEEMRSVLSGGPCSTPVFVVLTLFGVRGRRSRSGRLSKAEVSSYRNASGSMAARASRALLELLDTKRRLQSQERRPSLF